MTGWTLRDFATAAGGALDDSRPFRGVSIDTRDLTPGQVFVAMRGERVDGHAFLQAAHDAGAAAALVEALPAEVPSALPLIRVDDALAAMTAAARDYREHLRAAGTRVAGITGSNGKTGTVRMLHAALRAAGLVGTHARKSFNNEIGVPITLLGAKPGDDYLLCEIGTNAPGEIETLTRLARPDIAAITSIGRAHLERLGSVAGVAREKSQILAHAEPSGVGVIPAGIDLLEAALAEIQTPRLVRMGEDIPLDVLGVDAAGVRFRVFGHDAALPVPAPHMARNAGIALAIARKLGVELAAAVAGLSGYPAEPGRLSVRTAHAPAGEVILIDDSYNANPDSVLAALDTLAAWSGAARRVAVLGDMFELGDHEAQAHDEVLTRARSVADVTLAVGPRMSAAAAAAAGRAGAVIADYADAEAAAAALPGVLVEGDVVLVKGSRAMALERVCAAIGPAA